MNCVVVVGIFAFPSKLNFCRPLRRVRSVEGNDLRIAVSVKPPRLVRYVSPAVPDQTQPPHLAQVSHMSGHQLLLPFAIRSERPGTLNPARRNFAKLFFLALTSDGVDASDAAKAPSGA